MSGIQRIFSVNEWGRLREIIIGNPDQAWLPSMNDLSQRNFDRLEEHECIGMVGKPMPEWVIEQTAEDIEGLANTLKSFDVKTHFADSLDGSQPVVTPYWTAEQESFINIRDITLIYGDLVIDSPSPTRGRQFETLAVRRIFSQAKKNGVEFHHISPPRPQLLDDCYDLARPQGLNETEPLFDAANCVRLGSDIIIDINNTANSCGADWLQRNLDSFFGTRKVTVHKVSFSPDHIDVVIVPLREGQLLYNPKYVHPDQLPEAVSNWDLIEAPPMISQPFFSGTPKASDWIGLNLLVLDGESKCVIVEKEQTHLIKLLDRLGYQTVPVRWRHGRTWGGAFHCVTLDVCRDGSL